MLSLLSSVVAPDVPPVQDFRHHWDQFLHYYSTRPHAQLKSEPIEATNLTFHLNKMLKLLVEEQALARSPQGMAPSLEFLLHHNVLDILVTLCQADSPPGIRLRQNNTLAHLQGMITSVINSQRQRWPKKMPPKNQNKC